MMGVGFLIMLLTLAIFIVGKENEQNTSQYLYSGMMMGGGMMSDNGFTRQVISHTWYGTGRIS
jgi:hypothetical protein